jgi:hypothetical protein
MKELVKPNVINDELHLIENYCEGTYCSKCIALECSCREVALTSISSDEEEILF